jgi:hypothetical protein
MTIPFAEGRCHQILQSLVHHDAISAFPGQMVAQERAFLEAADNKAPRPQAAYKEHERIVALTG